MLFCFPFVMMALAYLCIASSFSSFSLFPLFISSHGGSTADVGAVMGILSLSSVICRPWASEMVDRLGRKRSFTIGCAVMTAVPAGYFLLRGSWSELYAPLLAARALHGMGLAISVTAAFTYVVDIIPKERLNEGIGVFGISGLSGMAVGPALGELIIRHFGFPMFFLAASGIAALGLVLQLPLPDTYTVAARGQEKTVSFFSLLGNHTLNTVAILSLLFGFGLAGSGSFVTPFANQKKIDFISLYFIAYSSAAILTRVLGGKIADRVGERQVIPVALTITGIGLLLLLFLTGTSTLAFSGFMTGFGHGFLFPSLNALAIRGQPAVHRGKITGICTGSIDAGGFVGSIVLGYVGEYAGFRVLFLLAGLSLLSGLIVFRARLGASSRAS